MKDRHKINALQEILDYQPPKVVRSGNLLLLLVINLIILLAFIVKIPTEIESKGILTSNPPVAKIYNIRLAKVDSIFVQDNSHLMAGSPIILLQSAASYSDILLLKKILNDFEKDSLKIKLDDSKILELGSMQTKFSNFENKLLKTKLFYLYNQDEVKLNSAKLDIETLRYRLNNLENKLSIDYKKLRLLQKDKKRIQTLYKKGVVSKQELENAQIKEYEGRLKVNDTKTEIQNVKVEINNSSESVNINDINISRENQNLKSSLYQSFNELKTALKEWENNNLIVAPRSGFFNFNENFYTSDFIREDKLIGSIIDTANFKPIVNLYTPIKNSGKIKLNQKVNIKFDNYDYIEYGIFYGKVNSISNVTDINNNYLVKVSLPDGLLSSYNKKVPFKSDITCSAKIVVDKKSFMEKLFFQFKDIIYNN